ncbi:ROK family protein [Candidatus Bipolaricaulota bacterium]
MLREPSTRTTKPPPSCTPVVVWRAKFRYAGDMTGVIAGFDIGGTKVSLAVEDSSGTRVHQSIEATGLVSVSIDYAEGHSTYRGLVEQLERMLRAVLVKLGGPRIEAIGIVSAGPILRGGLWSPPNIVPEGIAESHRELPCFMPLVAPLADAFACPVDLVNDCSGAILGEVYYGLGKDTPDKSMLHIAYATISTGFGVGAWDGGRLVLGKDGNAGELGHIVARENGLLCGCGNRGCVEAYASGSGIVGNARKRLLSLDDAERKSSLLVHLLLGDNAQPAPPSTIETYLDKLSPMLVFEAARKHDPVAQSVLNDAIYAAGIAFSAIANAYDPDVIFVGGGIMLANPELLEPIREEMLRHLNVIPPEVCMTPLGAQVTLQGALAIARS